MLLQTKGVRSAINPPPVETNVNGKGTVWAVYVKKSSRFHCFPVHFTTFACEDLPSLRYVWKKTLYQWFYPLFPRVLLYDFKNVLTPMRQLSALRYTTFRVKHPASLLDFIEQALDGISRSRAKSILSGGGVRVDRKNTTRHDLPLVPGQVVEISKRKPKGELTSKFVKIVYEDPHIIVIEKAIGILSMATSHHSFCVKQVLDDYFRRTHQKCNAHVVHRLDRDTSGLLVYAKTIEAEQILEHNWREIVTDRRYLALCSGEMPLGGGTIESYLRDNKAYFTYSSPTEVEGSKYALTRYRVLRCDGKHSLVELKLETGRKNQIRVHTQDLGHPVCGDTKYGNGDDPIGRLALHAFRLHFYHPITGEHLKFETDVPKGFRIKAGLY